MKYTIQSVRKPRHYYILVERDKDGFWAMEFVDYTRADVEAEREDRRDHGVKAKNLKIIRLNTDTQAAIDAEILQLNE